MLEDAEPLAVQEAACRLADMSMRWRCQGAPDSYVLWRNAVNSRKTLDGANRSKVLPFITTAFGTPTKPKPLPHLCGWIAEFLWFCVNAEQPTDINRNLVRLEGPSLHATEPGGDGLAVWDRSKSGGPLSFCLWEIKNNTGESTVSATVSRAYSQLGDRATEYLAKMTSISAAVESDASLQDLYARLVDLWVDDDDRAGAGVAVGTHSSKAPKKCFSTMHKHFPGKTTDGQLEGLVVAVGDLEEFSKGVRSRIWNAL